jgi:hypothetical protein
MSNLYSVRVTNGSQVQYYRVDFYYEALNLVSGLMNKLGDNIKVLVKKLIYDNNGVLVDTVVKMDIE